MIGGHGREREGVCLDVPLRASHVWLPYEKVEIYDIANLRRKVQKVKRHEEVLLVAGFQTKGCK